MEKNIIYFLFIFIFISCKITDKKFSNRFNLAGKTYSMHSELGDEIAIIDFQDSTFTISGKKRANKWKLTYYENIPFLNFGNTVFGIKKITDSTFTLDKIGFENVLKMSLLKTRWDKEMIYGTWIEKRYVGTDSADFPPPPIEKLKTNWPPYYKLSENKIELDFYKKSQSDIKISNNGEFISMDLTNSIYNKVEKQWRIKFLSDSMMIINKSSLPSSYLNTFEKNREEVEITLLKKR